MLAAPLSFQTIMPDRQQDLQTVAVDPHHNEALDVLADLDEA